MKKNPGRKQLREKIRRSRRDGSLYTAQPVAVRVARRRRRARLARASRKRNW